MSKKKVCVVCEKGSDEIPLIKFKFKGEKYAICSQHMPVLIHKPQELAEKLPKAENLPAGEHDH